MSTLPEGFELHKDWLGPGGLEDLLAQVSWKQEKVRLFGKEHDVPRLTAWMGDAPYSYSGVLHTPGSWHPLVAMIRTKLKHDGIGDFNSCLLNYYRNGDDKVSWHADDEPELGDEPLIASVSLGATRTFHIKTKQRPADTWSVPLKHGDLLVMSGRSQTDYLHALPPTKAQVTGRINLTFRSVRA